MSHLRTVRYLDPQEIVKDENPEFWPVCKCPYFTMPTGSLSCYGDEMVTTLKCLADGKGAVDLKALTSAIGNITRRYTSVARFSVFRIFCIKVADLYSLKQFFIKILNTCEKFIYYGLKLFWSRTSVGA